MLNLQLFSTCLYLDCFPLCVRLCFTMYIFLKHVLIMEYNGELKLKQI